MTDAWSLLTDATIQATFLIARDRGVDLAGKNAEIAESLKSVIKERIPTIQKEWKDWHRPPPGEFWLRKLFEVQAIELAILVLKHMNLWEVT